MGLPPCHSRRTLDPDRGVFFCAHPLMHAPNNLVTPEICSICSLWREPPPATFRPVVLAKPRGRCRHLGESTGVRPCSSCRGVVNVKVFACDHPNHGQTTLRECETCPDHEPCPETDAAGP
jgi:hypothetical protein